MESTRDRILRIAADLFAQNGFHGTGLTELSNSIGLGRGAMYHHIKSKDQLHADIAYVPIRMAVTEAQAISKLDVLPEEKVLLLSCALAEAIQAKMNPWIVFFREFSSLPANDQRAILVLREEYLAQWKKAHNAGIRSGVFLDEPPVFLDGLLPLFIYAHIWKTNRDDASERDLGRLLGEFILRGLCE